MADGNRTTLLVAVAGIAATALVGLAGTAVAWQSAQDDRETQRALARDERTYDRRVAAYLDAIDFVESQKRSFDLWFDTLCTERLCASNGDSNQVKVPYKQDPPPRLISRLRAFGSAQVFKAFEKTQRLNEEMPITWQENAYIVGPPFPYVEETAEPGSQGVGSNPDPAFQRAFRALAAEVIRFEAVVHDEVN